MLVSGGLELCCKVAREREHSDDKLENSLGRKLRTIWKALHHRWGKPGREVTLDHSHVLHHKGRGGKKCCWDSTWESLCKL